MANKASYSNQVHQLFVTVSKYMYFNKDWFINYRKKPLEVSLQNGLDDKREYIIFYVLRDQFSGNFVFHATTSYHLFPLADFLYYAWGKNHSVDFLGLPEEVVIPKIISTEGLSLALEKLGITTSHPSSGFSSGIRIIKVIEEKLKGMLMEYLINDPSTLIKAEKLVHLLSHRKEKVIIWKRGLVKENLRIPSQDDFFSYFPEDEELAPGIDLTGPKPHEGRIRARSMMMNRRAFPSPYKRVSAKREEEAKELMDEAYDYLYIDKEEGFKRTIKALKKDPNYYEAYYLLGTLGKNSRERFFLYYACYKVAKRTLGEEFFRPGMYWDFPMRPYMRSLWGMAQALEELGRITWPAKIYKNMLRLNPVDNQGIRYLLPKLLFIMGDMDGLQEIFSHYSTDDSTFMNYNLALYQFIKGDEEAIETLELAYENNSFVPLYLLGEKRFYKEIPYYSPGTEDEAKTYSYMSREAWEKTEGALKWLGESLEEIL